MFESYKQIVYMSDVNKSLHDKLQTKLRGLKKELRLMKEQNLMLKRHSEVLEQQMEQRVPQL
jgi:hypothetical protein